MADLYGYSQGLLGDGNRVSDGALAVLPCDDPFPGPEALPAGRLPEKTTLDPL